MGTYHKEYSKATTPNAIKRVFKNVGRGRYGFSFYLKSKEVFIGLEITDVIVPVKTADPKKILKKAKVTYVPTRN